MGCKQHLCYLSKNEKCKEGALESYLCRPRYLRVGGLSANLFGEVNCDDM